MTRTDVMASSRPRTAGETATRWGIARARRALLLIPVLALLAVALAGPGTAIAAEGTSGYGGTPTTPTTTPTPTTPTTGTSPSKESETPASKEEPSKSATSPTKESSKSSTKSGTLPFTGFDLRWSFAIGLALMGAGFSIIVVQRRSRRSGSR